MKRNSWPLLPHQLKETLIVSNTTPTTTSTTNKPPLQPSSPTYDYKAELDQLTNEIENKLMQHFATLFAQMDQKIKNLAWQYEKQHAEQMKKTWWLRTTQHPSCQTIWFPCWQHEVLPQICYTLTQPKTHCQVAMGNHNESHMPKTRTTSTCTKQQPENI